MEDGAAFTISLKPRGSATYRKDVRYALACAAWLMASALAVPGADVDLPALLKSVEKRYNNARTLQIDFSEAYSLPGRGRMLEDGQLSLRKPGKMRWNYAKPVGKVFVSHGKFVYYYSPEANRAEKMKLKETEDMRAPLAFLLGRLEFDRDFKEYRSRREGDAR